MGSRTSTSFELGPRVGFDTTGGFRLGGGLTGEGERWDCEGTGMERVLAASSSSISSASSPSSSLSTSLGRRVSSRS